MKKNLRLIQVEKRILLIASFSIAFLALHSQNYIGKGNSTTSTPLPKPSQAEYFDLDNDGDPDMIKGFIFGDVPIIWIDDDDDMLSTDLEGDLDNDCLLVDRNKDGVFAGAWDLSMDRIDEDGDGKADMEVVVENNNPDIRGKFDWGANYIWNIDWDNDGAFSYINWDLLVTRGWEHTGNCGFYNDYIGQTTFTKMSISSFRISDFRYSWENPFLFYDYDNDGYAEAAIRLIDDPIFSNSTNQDLFKDYGTDIDVLYEKKITWVSESFDMDNKNGPGNEFDFDMTLNYSGPGFDYTDQVHPIINTKRETLADKFFFDSRWRNVSELIYPDHENARNLVSNRGEWNSCWFTFDEDNDCKRWERVELYQPKDPFIIGMAKGGIDNNNQADAAGDRGEWDEDFSGKGKLYIGQFDGLIHLFGAEWGCWRMDPFAESFQGYGGLYDTTKWARLQTIPKKYATIKYTDTDENGFFDKLEFDLDSNKVFERTITLSDLDINDENELIIFDSLNYSGINELYEQVANNNWDNAQKAIPVALQMGIDTSAYRYLMNPGTLREKYYSGFWLNFNIYNDLRKVPGYKDDPDYVMQLDKAYFSRDWESFTSYTTAIYSQNINAPFSLEISPNPTSDFLSVHIGSALNDDFHITIIGMDGRIIFDNTTKEKQIELDLNSYNPGIYCIIAKSGQYQKVTKFVLN